jgi:hypothetical protein
MQLWLASNIVLLIGALDIFLKSLVTSFNPYGLVFSFLLALLVVLSYGLKNCPVSCLFSMSFCPVFV